MQSNAHQFHLGTYICNWLFILNNEIPFRRQTLWHGYGNGAEVFWQQHSFSLFASREALQEGETGWVRRRCRSTANAVFLERKRSCQQDATAVLINRAAWLKFTNNNNQSKSSTAIARRQTRLCLCTHNRTPLNLLINWPCLLSPAIYYAKPPQPVDEKS